MSSSIFGILILLFVTLASLSFALPVDINSILESMKTKHKKMTNVRVLFKGDNIESVFERMESRRSTSDFTSRDEKENEFYKTLKANAVETQDKTILDLQAFLDCRDAPETCRRTTFTQMWLINQLFVWNADEAVLNLLAALSDVSGIEEEIFYETDLNEAVRQTERQSEQVQWGVRSIQAPLFWKQGEMGKGAVVGIIDTGVRETHEALRDNWRSENGWYDPYTNKERPFDPNGHGTHVAGIAVGTKGIGVAPEAQWIACRGLTNTTVGDMHLEKCMQWMHCPTDLKGNDLDCSKRPHIVNNSWGGGSRSTPGEKFRIKAWLQNNIVPIFATGNSGPGCSTVVAPALQSNVIAVGASNEKGGMLNSSSSGPVLNKGIPIRVKPDIVAPGEHIYSASYRLDREYAISSGTSMAAPHVAGLAAVYYGKFPNLPVKTFMAALIKGVKPVIPTGNNCGGVNETEYPNNRAGYGVIDFVEFDKALKVLLKRSNSNGSFIRPSLFFYCSLVFLYC